MGLSCGSSASSTSYVIIVSRPLYAHKFSDEDRLCRSSSCVLIIRNGPFLHFDAHCLGPLERFAHPSAPTEISVEAHCARGAPPCVTAAYAYVSLDRIGVIECPRDDEMRGVGAFASAYGVSDAGNGVLEVALDFASVGRLEDDKSHGSYSTLLPLAGP